MIIIIFSKVVKAESLYMEVMSCISVLLWIYIIIWGNRGIDVMWFLFSINFIRVFI